MTLRQYRKSLGKSQAQFAHRIGVTQQAYSQWESGTRSPGSEVLLLMAEKLRVIITIKPDTREFHVIPEKDWVDPDAGKTEEQIMDTYAYMFEEE